ncbi:MAG TPA: hypothetical protein VMB21_14375, partial [Candidatus Limnocylindria bacterium]|nr:hypothetical protein [Candidatus Limnocylindria bacterium]
MNERTSVSCSECGSALPESAHGFCPRCLLGLAVKPPETESNGLPANRYFGGYELLERIGQG